MTKEKNKMHGITLIALIITIIVLLILAGVSIATIVGDNGILSQANKSKIETEMASIKERAELAGANYSLDALTDSKNPVVNRNNFVNEIKKEFEGSIVSGSVITTGDMQYDIVVDDDLNITVVRHQQSENGISFVYLELETESRAEALQVYPVLENVGQILTYYEYAQDIINNLSETEKNDELNRMFIEGENYWGLYYGHLDEGTVFADINDVWDYWRNQGWGDYAYTTVQEYYNEERNYYDSCEEWLISYEYIEPEEYYNKYGIEITISCSNGETETINLTDKTYALFAITKNGEYTVSVTDKNANTMTAQIEATKVKEEKFSTIYTTNTELEIDGYKVTIPAGFAVGTSSRVNSVKEGLVITDSVDSEGYSTGNEFVWIPVNEDLTVGNTGKIMAALQTDSTTDYRGVLYNWNQDKNGNVQYEWSSVSTGIREPDIVTADGGEYDTVGITKEKLQTEYNSMIDGVKKHGGFYISRYEMGVENSKPISKLGVMPALARDEESKLWYGLYDKAGSYSNSYDSVQSSMIWGSQIDALINFALSNGEDVYQSFLYDESLCMYMIFKTGITYLVDDEIMNIYDFCGNAQDWTLTTRDAKYRMYRGESNIGHAYYGSLARYDGMNQPTAYLTWTAWGSRFTLYIK